MGDRLHSGGGQRRIRILEYDRTLHHHLVRFHKIVVTKKGVIQFILCLNKFHILKVIIKSIIIQKYLLHKLIKKILKEKIIRKK